MFLYCSCHVDVTDLETVGSDELVHDIDEDVSGDVPPKDDVGVLEMAEEVAGQRCCLVYEDYLLQIATLNVCLAIRQLQMSNIVNYISCTEEEQLLLKLNL